MLCLEFDEFGRLEYLSTASFCKGVFELCPWHEEREQWGITWRQGVVRSVFNVVTDKGFVEWRGSGGWNLVGVADKDEREVNVGLNGLIALKNVTKENAGEHGHLAKARNKNNEECGTREG